MRFSAFGVLSHWIVIGVQVLGSTLPVKPQTLNPKTKSKPSCLLPSHSGRSLWAFGQPKPSCQAAARVCGARVP